MSNLDAYLVEQIYTELERAIGDQRISPESVIKIATVAMVIVERHQVSGSDKRALVLAVLHKSADALRKRDISKEDRATLHTVIDTVVPAAIDAIVDATKGGIDVNKIKSRWAWFKLNCCCCCVKPQ